MIKQSGWACFQPKDRVLDQNQEQNNKYGIFSKTKFFGGLESQRQPRPDNDDDPSNTSKGIFFSHIGNSEIDESDFNENYPFGNMIEYYDIEREKEMCLNENICSVQADAS